MLFRRLMSAEVELLAGFAGRCFEGDTRFIDSPVTRNRAAAGTAGADEIKPLLSWPVLCHVRDCLERTAYLE